MFLAIAVTMLIQAYSARSIIPQDLDADCFFRRTLADSQFNLNFPLKSYDRYSDYSASCVWYPSFLLLFLRLSFIFPSSSSLSLSLSLLCRLVKELNLETVSAKKRISVS